MDSLPEPVDVDTAIVPVRQERPHVEFAVSNQVAFADLE